jgi:excinuclease ABC subunit C
LTPSAVSHFAELLDHLGRVSAEPGVYLMKDAAGAILYVGKARNLKKRLSSYFRRPEHPDVKTGVLVGRIASFDTIITRTEKEALILESNLIKKHRPRYNVILKDDKRYPSLRLDIQNPYPSLTIVRRIQKDGALYFGPFTAAQAVHQTLRMINKTFKLRKCRDNTFRNRIRPCLHYQMQRCLAPCCMEVQRSVYDEIVREVILFLRGRTPDLIRKIRDEMQEAGRCQEFEKAAVLRDKMFALEKTLEKQGMVTTDFMDRDVVGIAGTPGCFLVTVLFVRAGFLQGSRHFRFEETLADPNELIDAFIRQFYDSDRFIAKEILLPAAIEDADLIEEWLGERKGEKVRLLFPQRGEKVRLMDMAAQNAQNELDQFLSAQAGQRDLMVRLGRRLQMDRVPDRIECFDNSNISGTDPVAAMVVFEGGQAKRSAYRRYRIRTVSSPDDYATMAEVLTRRLNPKKRKADYPDILPDILMVDGGKGQLNIGRMVVSELGLDGAFQMIGIAKKEGKETQDKVYLPGRANPVHFGKDGDLLLFLQRVRDEAHRFAIAYHRKQRSRRAVASALDAVPGIGKKRKIALLKHFGSIGKIREADVHALAAVPGMTVAAAASVKQQLGGKIPGEFP